MFVPLFDRDICIKCLRCVGVCPRLSLRIYNNMPTRAKFDATIDNSCTGCGYCSMVCPTNAVYQIYVDEKAEGNWSFSNVKDVLYLAETGKIKIEGEGTSRRVLNFDKLVFVPAQLNKKPLLNKEEVNTKIIIGKKAKRPVVLEMPILIGAMSFGALSMEAKMAIAKGASLAGTITNTGEGGMLEQERKNANLLTIQYSTGRFGINDKVLKRGDMIEIKIGQGAKPGMGGELLKSKVTEEIAKVRHVEMGKDIISPSRHLDIRDKKDWRKRVKYLRKLTDGKPIGFKIAAGDIEKDLSVALYAKPDFIAIDGMGGGTGAAPKIAEDNAGIPTLAALSRAVEFLEKKKVRIRVSLLIGGGLRNGADFAKALALGADAVYIAESVKIAMGCVRCRACNTGRCNFGIATQDIELRKRLNINEKSKKVANFLKASNEEIKLICRLMGKSDIKQLDKNDLRALDKLTAEISKVKLV